MMIEFKVKNWMSFKEDAVFNMMPGSISEYPQNKIEYAGIDTLKSAVLYGANASGKSNLLKAIEYYRNFTILSAKIQQKGDRTSRRPFRLDLESLKEPTAFEMTFSTKKGNIYRYGFLLDDEKVYEEWLDIIEGSSAKVLLERNIVEEKLIVSKKLTQGIPEKVIKNAVNKNTLVLSFLGTISSDAVSEIMDFMKNIEYIDNTYENFMSKEEKLEIETNKEYKNQLLLLLQALDLGIKDIRVDVQERKEISLLHNGNDQSAVPISELPDEIKRQVESESATLLTSHILYDRGEKTEKTISFPFEMFESKGTQKMITLAYKIINAIKNGHILVIDELDTQLHPLMLRAIIGLFNSEANKNGAQLIFSTHDITLIDKSAALLRRDQIWFTEKNLTEESSLYSLFEFKYEDNGDYKSIRKDENYAKNYLRGKYQAVPIINSLSEQLSWEECLDEEE